VFQIGEAHTVPELDLPQELAEGEVSRLAGAELEVVRPLREAQRELTDHLPLGAHAPVECRNPRVLEDPLAVVPGTHRVGVDAPPESEGVGELVEADVGETVPLSLPEVVDPVAATEPMHLLEVGPQLPRPAEGRRLDFVRPP